LCHASLDKSHWGHVYERKDFNYEIVGVILAYSGTFDASKRAWWDALIAYNIVGQKL